MSAISCLPALFSRARCGLLPVVLIGSSLAAQQSDYRIELSGGAGLHHFDRNTELAETFGLSGRLGYWVYGPISLEGEFSYAHPHTNTLIRTSLNTTTLAGWLVLNKRVGSNSSLFLRGGYGSTSYGRCASISQPGTGPCGSAGVIQGGLGARLGLTRTLLLRSDVTVNRSLTSLKFSNVTLQGGLSLMLGPSGTDSDQDGVPDRADRCANTARGTTVDARGCTLDADKDGVGDRFDRCPGTPAGLPVDISGCPSDGDQDGVPDGLDQCNDTPRNSVVDARGCPRESPKPAVPTPQPPAPRAVQPTPAQPPPRVPTPGARDTSAIKPVPVTPPAARDTAPRPAARDTALKPAPRDTAPKPAPAPAAAAAPAPPAERTWVLPGSVWAYRAAILDPAAFPILDSVAAALKANPEAKAEVVGHAYDRLIPADDIRLSQYRAEAVRSYLTFKGVPVSRITAVGRGSSPLIDRGTTEEARARNRRVEIRITYPAR